MSELWKIYLFKELRAVRLTQAEQSISRFRTQKARALLAFLAFYPQAHSRELLAEMLWPESEPSLGSQSLRTSLSSLRRQLEPPDVAEGSVFIATRTTLQLNPQAVQTDVAAFRRAGAAARRALQSDSAFSENEKIAFLESALEEFHGALLPGIYEEWIGLESQRLDEEYFELLHQLLPLLEASENLSRALHFAREGVRRDDSRTETRALLKRYCNALGVAFDSLELEKNAGFASADTRKPACKKPRRKKKIAPIFAPDETSEENSESEIFAADFSSSAVAPPVFLPALLNKFFGRETEVARVRDEFARRKTRMFTLSGSGGSGKTRLAIEAAALLAKPDFSDQALAFSRALASEQADADLAAGPRAVYFVSLADLRDGDLIVSAILEVLGLPHSKRFLSGVSLEARPVDRLCAALSTHRTLLVLDNFEHLASTGAQFVEMLLARVPELQILVTSQHRLNIPGEREMPVGTLPTPHENIVTPEDFPRNLTDKSSEKTRLTALLEYSSVQLFVDRAQAVAPDFQLTSHNADSVAEICRQLEGVPLAIELASARCNVFTPTQIAARLQGTSEKFATLTNIRRAATPRHASIHTAISWSYELLPLELARFWAQLSVFRGGFSFESAQAVCRESNAPHWLSQLRASSLVVVEEQGGTMRFRVPEMLREFVQDQLTPEQLEEIRHRHALHFEEKLFSSLRLLRTSQECEALSQAAFETDNARAALDWVKAEYSAAAAKKTKNRRKFGAAKHAEYSVLAARTSLALGTLLQRRGLHGEALSVLEAGLEVTSHEPVEPDLGVALLREHAGVLLDLLQWETASCSARKMLDLCRNNGNHVGVAAATNLIGLAAKGEEKWQQARQYFSDVLRQFEKLGDIPGIAIAHNNLGLIEYLDDDGDKILAQNYLQRGLELRHQLRDVRGVAEAEINLGALAQQVKEIEAARAHYEAALKIELQLRHTFGVGRAMCNLGEVAESRDEILRAYRCYISAHALFELSGVAYQKYSAIQSSRLAGAIENSDKLLTHARRLARSGALEDLVDWANEIEF